MALTSITVMTGDRLLGAALVRWAGIIPRTWSRKALRVRSSRTIHAVDEPDTLIRSFEEQGQGRVPGFGSSVGG